ncbi:leucine-rich repeat-containing protein 59 [Osmia lignaria lignaria]|uniref:leucine-rich repeat-containing protein 59-like n=1 Tax=Osmia lignaria TaxID=473952 RepID=UPI00147890FA|nr:leucine-rich repeat-containing protein 59-like [Osmia lignaria]XP_034173045.1 leucine-rich repeat-containing protein 59-like [Osmia lignaria]XP_034173053.1 leucine-rich repeat-containing protein 59-like [Osmia lignaria]
MNLKSVKDRLKDETLDLSLCDLKEVPVREITTIKKATHLDLSNNLLTSLPTNFINLKQIVKLDLSRNMLTEIPENFGELRQLKHLDLYANQISRLPLSLSELKNLRWLDLKENPLTPAVASVAGPCSNLSECQACARNIVTYLSHVKLTIEEEKLRRLNAIIDTETDTVSTKKTGKKKKKKAADKDNKPNLDKNERNSLPKLSRSDESEMKNSTATNDRKYTDKQSIKGNTCRTFLHTITWLFLFSSILLMLILILPLYSKQSELLVNHFETNMGIPLKTIQQRSTDMFYSFTRSVSNVYKDIYYVYEKNFNTNKDISINE